MPYRVAIDTTLARCERLQERVRELERELGLPWKPPLEFTTRDMDVLARAERILETRIADLEEERAARAVIAGAVVVHHDVSETPSLSHLVIASALALAGAVIVVFALQFTKHREVAVPVVQHAPGHTLTWSEHCNVFVTRVKDACDVDIACVTTKRHALQDHCEYRDGILSVEGVDVDISKRTVHFVDDGKPIDIELDPWR